jgi:hypothetical protein
VPLQRCWVMQVCQEADRFRMARPNDDTAVESFKRLDLDYLEVGDNYGLVCIMLGCSPRQPKAFPECTAVAACRTSFPASLDTVRTQIRSCCVRGRTRQ